MYNVVSVARTTVLQYVLLALFTLNFSWIALAFTSGVVGFVALPAHATDTASPRRSGTGQSS